MPTLPLKPIFVQNTLPQIVGRVQDILSVNFVGDGSSIVVTANADTQTVLISGSSLPDVANLVYTDHTYPDPSFISSLAWGKLTSVPSSVANLTGTNTGDQNLFSLVEVSGQANVTATTPTQALTLANGTAMALTTNNVTKTVTIAFTGTNAAALSDYASGTWTPVDASGDGLSLTVSSATYIKIGRIVTFQADITYPATASSNNALISGLPTKVGNYTTGSFVSFNLGEALTVLAIPNGAANGLIQFYNSQTGVVAVNSNLTLGRVLFSVTYIAV
jgi:hypothetical protein